MAISIHADKTRLHVNSKDAYYNPELWQKKTLILNLCTQNPYSTRGYNCSQTLSTVPVLERQQRGSTTQWRAKALHQVLASSTFKGFRTSEHTQEFPGFSIMYDAILFESHQYPT